MFRCILICLLTGILVPFQGKTQERSDSLLLFIHGIVKADYDYSSMGDTVIIEYGNCSIGGQSFFKMEDSLRFGRMCFARRELTVEKGKLVKELIYDSNSGNVTIVRYKANGETDVKTWYYQASNAPHPEWYKE